MQKALNNTVLRKAGFLMPSGLAAMSRPDHWDNPQFHMVHPRLRVISKARQPAR